MDFEKGLVVIANCGKDKGKLSMVVQIDETFIWVADGKRRRLDNPKRKNAKHLFTTLKVVDVNSLTSNKQLSQMLRQMAEQMTKEGRSLV